MTAVAVVNLIALASFWTALCTSRDHTVRGYTCGLLMGAIIISDVVLAIATL